MHNLESILENETQKFLCDFEKQMDHLIPARPLDLITIINNNKRISRIMNFAVPADHKVKLKESEKKDKYLDLARELKKTVEYESDGYNNSNWCSLYSHQKWAQEDLKITGWIENIQTTALLRSARILWRDLETWGDLLSLKLQWKTIS